MKKSILIFIICIIALLTCFSCGKDEKPTGPTDNGLTEAEKQAIIEAHDSIAVTADSVLFTDDPIEGFKELLPSYRSYANVESAWVTDNALYVRYEKGGVESWIITPNVIIPPWAGPSTMRSMPKPTGIKGLQELIGNDKVCVINQTYKDERFQKATEVIAYLSDLFQNNEFEVTVKNGEDADLEFFADSLSKFGVIFIHTHGSFSYFGLTTWLLTGEEPSTFDEIFSDVAWWRIGKIGISNITEKRNGECVKISYFKISQRFIDSKYSEGDFPHSLVYLTACEGLKSTDHFPKVFSEKGVAVTIGWDEVNNLGIPTGKLLFESLLLRCYNLETAFNSLPDEAKHGGRDFPPGECSGGLSIEEGANLTYYPSTGGSVQLCEVPQVVHFADPNLETVIREKINKPSGDIYLSDVAGIHHLCADNRQIIPLDGIESLVSLTDLYLCDNQISNLAPLSGLTSLTDLGLGYNQISNLAPLSGLTSLTDLWLGYNQISNLAPLSGLTSLTDLWLGYNQISNLAPLSGLTSLTDLGLGYNQISNLEPLSGLTSLTDLGLANNQISNLEPLSGLTSLTVFYPFGNQISNLEPLSGLTSLTLLRLDDNQISNLEPLSGLTNLTWLDLEDNQVSNLAPLSGLTNLTWLFLSGNQISNLEPLSGLTSLTQLRLSNNQISNLEPLSGLTSLTDLWLYDNQISNLEPFSGLTSLTDLYLYDNQISNLAPLSGLTSLTQLRLFNNQISNLAPLSGLTSLTSLGLSDNQISDLYPLVENEGLGTGDVVNVQENPLSETSISDYIPALRARGVEVHY